MNSNYGRWFLAWVFVVAQISQASAEKDLCKIFGVKHTVIGELTCCKLKDIETTPLQDTTGWTECVGKGTDDNEIFSTTMWRLYTCTLGKLLPKNQKTINLKEFAELRISNFSESNQKRILNKIKEDMKDSKKSWLNSDVELSDYPSVDKLRIHYFNIEKNVCGFNGTDLKWGDYTAANVQRSPCQFEEELLHRGGECCGNITLPLSISKWRLSVTRNCNHTLKAQFDRIVFKNKSVEVERELKRICVESCSLIARKLLTVEKLLNVQVNDTIETDEIVNDHIGSYVSKAVLETVQHLVREWLNTTEVLETVEAKWADNINDPTEMFGCSLYHEIIYLINSALDNICVPLK